MSNSDLLLIGMSFLTSAFTAVAGVGGGLTFVGVLSGFLPVPAVIPIHGITQFASNFSRAAFGRNHLHWEIIRPFLAGGAIGVTVGAFFVFQIPPQIALLVMAGYIILMTWVPGFLKNFQWPGRFIGLGAVMGLLGIFVGAVGPLSPPMLSREGLNRDAIVVTHAGFMIFLHLFKALAFGIVGFDYLPWLPLLVGLSLAAVAGSWIGTRIRGKVPESTWKRVLQAVLTLLSLRMIYQALIS